MSRQFLFSSEKPPLDNGPGNIDLLNDETFGSGAVEDDWENEHNQFAEQHSRSGSVDALGQVEKRLDEDELELSNRQLAAAVEELVLNSDQDQDAIDPAIVSLRKESRPGSYDPRLTENLISPYMGETDSFGRTTPTYGPRNSASSIFQSDGIKNIWSSTDLEVQDSFAKSPSMILERQMLNEKLRNMLKKSAASPELEDEAILTAVKATPATANWPIGPHQDSLLQQMFSHKTGILKAEDLEREFSKCDIRGPSPTFGISIPKENETNHNGLDRSLPARSVSPVIGSPTSHALPIGTPPKHVTDLLQAQKQGAGFAAQHPGHPGFPLHLQRPPQVFMMPPGRAVPPPGNVGPPRLWPPGMLNRPPMNPLLAQDIMNRIGGNKPFSMLGGSPPANMSPVGSPRFCQAQRMIPQPNVGFNQPMLRPGQVPLGLRGPAPPVRQFLNQRFVGPRQPPMYLGPGHLHPEHSRFVRMRSQQRGRSHSYNNHHHQRPHNLDSSPRDPHSNLMTSREKEWVIKIQMMALQSDRPEIDDYYYQHYIEKRLREGRLSLDDETSEQKRLITPTKANPDHKKYIPVQYDNSLGKLTVSSVYNPRQIIDVIHAEKDEETVVDVVDVKMSMNKRLEIYSIIEKAYSALLEMEEIRFHVESMNENMSEDGEEHGVTEKDSKYSKMLEELLFPNSEKEGSTEYISQSLRIRKGKKLICRVLPHVSRKNAVRITTILLKQLPILIKKDQRENILPDFYFPVCQVLKESDADELMEICSTLAPNCNSICKDKFGLSIVCKTLTVGGQSANLKKMQLHEKKHWDQFLSGCFKSLLLLGEKRSSAPHLLETGLENEVMEVLENCSELVSAGDEERKTHLKQLKEFFSRKPDKPSELLETT